MVLKSQHEIRQEEELAIIKDSLKRLAIQKMPLKEIFKNVWSEYQKQIFDAISNVKYGRLIDPLESIVVLDKIARFNFRDHGPSWDNTTEIGLLAADYAKFEKIFPYNSDCSSKPKFHYFVTNDEEKSKLLDKIKNTSLSKLSEEIYSTPNDERFKINQKQLFSTGYRGMSLGQEVLFQFWKTGIKKRYEKIEKLEGRLEGLRLNYLMAEFKGGLGTLDDSAMAYSMLSPWNGASTSSIEFEDYGTPFHRITNYIIIPTNSIECTKESLLKIPEVELIE